MATALDLIGISVLTRATALGGGDFNDVLAELDIHIANDNHAFKKLTVAEVDKLLTHLEAKCPQRHFAFAFGDVFNFDGLPEVAAFVVSSSNLREAAQLTQWLPTLIHPSIQIDDSRFDSNAIANLSFRHPNGETASMPVFAEIIAAVIKHFSNILAPQITALKSVRFAHAPRCEAALYEDYFQCPVAFNCHSNQIQFNAAALELPLPGKLPPAHQQAEHSIRAKLLQAQHSVTQQTQQLLKQNLALFSQGIDGVAAALHMHPRKLQRQLKTEGHNFSAVLAQARKNLACEMLTNSDIDIDSIGFKLGFEERRSFTAAFKKWTAKTPTAYRREHS